MNIAPQNTIEQKAQIAEIFATFEKTAKLADHQLSSNPLFIYGPQGCGKTRYAAALAKHFGKSNIVDDSQQRANVLMLSASDLVLTNDESELTNVNYLSFDEAMSYAGITSDLSSKTPTPPNAESTSPCSLSNQLECCHPHTNALNQDQASHDAISTQPPLPSTPE